MSIADDQVTIRDDLIATLEADLVGPMADDEILEAPPSRWYLTGFLVPSGGPDDHRIDPLASEEMSAAVDGDAPDDSMGDDVSPTHSFLPSSMGISFFVPANTRTVEVTASWGDYVRLDDADSRDWDNRERRRRCADPRPADDPVRDRYWERAGRKSFSLPVNLDRSGDRRPIPGTDGVMLQVLVKTVPAGEAPDGTRAVSLFLVNHRTADGMAEADERTLFQAELAVSCKAGFVPRYRTHGGDHPDDQRNDVQFRDHAEWAVGHGVSTEASVDGSKCRRVQTTWLPRAAVYRMKARSIDGVTTSMDDLAAIPDADALRAGMAPLIVDYRAWIETQRARIPSLASPRQSVATSLLDDAALALSRIEAGIDTLADPLALQAFQLANRAMAHAARRARPGQEPHWRLFQLAFVLLNLAASTDAQHVDRDRVDLLFFPTGGGKTEAYLGVAAYVLVLRRLRGRDELHGGAGVAVILRYTLRLLTLDQLRRAAQLICALELVRRELPDTLGRHRFSVGLWVGRKATANRLKDVAQPIRRLKATGKNWGGPAPVPLADCPWCGTPLKGDSFELVPDNKSPQALDVGCESPTCPFAFDPDAPLGRNGLPLVVVDEQVYRELPSMLIGTVDKFAALPWRGATGMLFGRTVAEGPWGFYGPHETPPKNTPVRDGCPPPELIIQDELHLISGPLGTMVGLYETAIDALCRDRVGYGPKVIASTATARRATEQIQAIFARDKVHLFPPQGLDAGDTYFARTDASPEKTRAYVGVAAPGRNGKAVAARVYTCLLGAAKRHWEAAGPPGKDNPGDTYMTLASYYNSLKDLGGAQRLVQEDVSQRTFRLSSRRPLQLDQSDHFADRSLAFDVVELTSRQSTDDIASAIARLNKAFDTGRGTRTDVLLASSMISVGVDIGRLGLMVVNGQPRTTAEYIQASSRVGRETPGLVVTSYNLFKPRDRSHYERFTAYHQSFYRSVEAASVTPFSARAIDRGLAGLVVALARHLGPRMAPNAAVTRIRETADPLRTQIVELLTTRAMAHKGTVPAAVQASLEQRIDHLLTHWKDLVHEVREASGSLRYSPWEKPDKYKAMLSTAVDELVGEDAKLREHFRAPTSMRDVEPSVHVWVDQVVVKGAE